MIIAGQTRGYGEPKYRRNVNDDIPFAVSKCKIETWSTPEAPYKSKQVSSITQTIF